MDTKVLHITPFVLYIFTQMVNTPWINGQNHKHDEKYQLPKVKGNTSMRQKVMEKTIEMRNQIETTKNVFTLLLIECIIAYTFSTFLQCSPLRWIC